MHFSEKPAGTPSKGARGGEYGIQKNYFIKQKQQALGETGHAFLFQCRDCLTASSVLKMTTQASTIQMRAGVVKESCLFIWQILLAWRQNLLLHLDSWENELHLLLQDLKMWPSEAKKHSTSFSENKTPQAVRFLPGKGTPLLIRAQNLLSNNVSNTWYHAKNHHPHN